MEKMTIEKAQEAWKVHQKAIEATDFEFEKAKGFIEGYESRDAEVEELKDKWHKAGWDDAMREKQAEVEELKKIIYMYGKHKIDCGRAYEGCTCGLSQLLAEHKGESNFVIPACRTMIVRERGTNE